MEWIQFAIFFIGVFGLFIWNRTESRSDSRHMDNQVKANRELIFEIHKEIHGQMQDFNNKFHEQMKDFHCKLCSINERIK